MTVGLVQHFQGQDVEMEGEIQEVWTQYCSFKAIFKAQVNLTGRYILTGYDEHYQNYLLALGVPMQAVRKILDT